MSDDSKRKGLGRGLSSLLEEDPDDQATIDRLRAAKAVPIEQLEPGPYQPRRFFDEDELQSLVESVRENGVLMPILVRRHPEDPGRYQIVAGERRWRAAQLAQLHEVPIIVKALSDAQSLELALIENVQRQDLTAIEEADGYRRLMDEFGHTQEELGRVLGKSRSHIANTLRLNRLPEDVRSLVHRGDLSAGHARALLMSADPTLYAKEVLKKGLNVRQTEKLVQQLGAEKAGAGGSAAPRKVKEKDVNIYHVEKQLSQRLGLKVTIDHKGEGGEVRIAYQTLDQFDDVLRRLSQPGTGAAVPAASALTGVAPAGPDFGKAAMDAGFGDDDDGFGDEDFIDDTDDENDPDAI